MNIENIITLMAAMGALITAIWTSRSMATKSELESLRKTIVSLQDENGRLQMDNERLRGRVDTLEQNSRAQDKSVAFLVDRVKLLETEKATLQTRVDQLEKRNTELQCENDNLKARIAELEKGKAE
jgi:regulator of replication initiation timing